MRVLFIFLDGVGLGADDPATNPFSRADMPQLRSLLGGRRLTASSAPFVGEQASLFALDAGLGVEGLPQSATGQAVLLTGHNVPASIGEHYGPKPNPAVARYLLDGTLFSRLLQLGKSAALLNAYPPRYFHGVKSGRRLLSSIPLAVSSAGIPLLTKDDFYAGRALSADFTGAAWPAMLGFTDAPVLTPAQAGRKLEALARQYDFSLFEYWASDYAGHKQDMEWALRQLEVFDGVLGGLVERWEPSNGIVVVTSDHGNMEDLSTRRHTAAQVPCLLIGASSARTRFARGLTDLTGIAPAIYEAVSSPV